MTIQRSVNAEQQVMELEHELQVMLAKMSLAGWALRHRRDGAWGVFDSDGRNIATWFSLSVCVRRAWKQFNKEEATNGQDEVHDQPTTR